MQATVSVGDCGPASGALAGLRICLLGSEPTQSAKTENTPAAAIASLSQSYAGCRSLSSRGKRPAQVRLPVLLRAQRDLKREDFSTLASGIKLLVAARAVLDLTTPGHGYQHTGTTQVSFETEFLSHTEHVCLVV